MKLVTSWLLGVAIITSGCSISAHYRKVGEPPQGCVNVVSTGDFDLHRIESIVLSMNGKAIASLKPQHIKLGTKQPDRQYAAWELTYLNPGPIYETLSEDDAELVIDRITPEYPTDRRIMLNPGPQVINIGGFDHTLIIWKPEGTPHQHHWVYYSGAGKVCGGTVAFVIKSDS